jgi:probable F420-dependent oxidoreductase
MAASGQQRPGLAMNLMGIDEWGGGHFAAVQEAARIADAMGVDRLLLPDHILMNEAAHRDRSGFPYPLTSSWYEPITALAAIAAVTSQSRLGMNVLIAPLRPATLLAKQIATLDAISAGRVEASFGVGWQREEYEAGERAFEGRFGMLEEQIEVCRALWGGDGVEHHGHRIGFEATWSRPLPPQGAAVPIYLGLALSPRNIERIVRLADGWAPAPMPPQELRHAISILRSSSDRAGLLKVTAATTLHPHGTRIADRSEVLDEVISLWDAGADSVIVQPHAFCNSMNDLEGFLAPLLDARDAQFAAGAGSSTTEHP